MLKFNTVYDTIQQAKVKRTLCAEDHDLQIALKLKHL